MKTQLQVKEMGNKETVARRIINSPAKQIDFSRDPYSTNPGDNKLQQLHNEKTKTVVKKHFENPISEETGKNYFSLIISSRKPRVCFKQS